MARRSDLIFSIAKKQLSTYNIKRQVNDTYEKRIAQQVVFSPTLPKWNYLIKPVN